MKINSFRIGWPLADREPLEYNGVLYVVQRDNWNEENLFSEDKAPSSRDWLPVEFFSHQFMEFDPHDQESMMTLVSTFGVPLHPRRFGIGGGVYLRGDSEYGRLRKAMSDTDKMRFSPVEESRVGLSEYWQTVNMIRFVASFEEVSFAVESLQNDISAMFDFLDGRANSWSANVINAGASNAFTIGTGVCAFPDFSLTNAICNQVIETAVSKEPWKKCACEGCGRWFKRFQPRNISNTGISKPSLSKYCCKRCQDKQGQANKRKAAKSRIQH